MAKGLEEVLGLAKQVFDALPSNFWIAETGVDANNSTAVRVRVWVHLNPYEFFNLHPESP